MGLAGGRVTNSILEPTTSQIIRSGTGAINTMGGGTSGLVQAPLTAVSSSRADLR
jgi:H+/Cl- antiporter ClcA